MYNWAAEDLDVYWNVLIGQFLAISLGQSNTIGTAANSGANANEQIHWAGRWRKEEM